MKKIDATSLERLLQVGLLSEKNSERLIRVFYDATKIVYERQKRLKKPQLKMKEISSALILAESLHSNLHHFEATGELAECFGTFSEETALEYYDKKVMGEVTDKFGRKILIDEDGLRSLYKEPETGKHIENPENYEEGRGKRLPWIRFALQNSESVYVSEEKIANSFRRSLIYASVVSIPLTPKDQTSYYVVVVRQEKGGENRFLTAYSIGKRNRFLCIIEKCQIPKLAV